MSDLDQRTIAPTDKRIADFRKRGDVPLSRELVTALVFAGAAIGTFRYGNQTITTLAELMQRSLSGESMPLPALLWQVTRCALPSAGGAILGYVIAVSLMIGWPPALQTPKFDPARLFSFDSIAKIISPKAMAGRIFTGFAKTLFVGLAGVSVLLVLRTELQAAPTLELGALVRKMVGAGNQLFWRAGGALIALAIGDFLWTKRQHMRRMRMTPEEFRREHREQEGDPQIKRRRRQRMRELAKRRVPAAVKSADVVLVNPTEYAVAIRYDAGSDRAPRVVAKGRGSSAERIRELARKAGVPVVPEPPLCRMLHKLVPEGREIPPQLFAAVAEVLAYVYRLRGRAR